MSSKGCNFHGLFSIQGKRGLASLFSSRVEVRGLADRNPSVCCQQPRAGTPTYTRAQTPRAVAAVPTLICKKFLSFGSNPWASASRFSKSSEEFGLKKLGSVSGPKLDEPTLCGVGGYRTIHASTHLYFDTLLRSCGMCRLFCVMWWSP